MLLTFKDLSKQCSSYSENNSPLEIQNMIKNLNPFECELNGDSSHQPVAPNTQLPSQVTIIDVGYTFLNEEELLAFHKYKIK